MYRSERHFGLSAGDDFPEPHMDGARSESVGAEHEPETLDDTSWRWADRCIAVIFGLVVLMLIGSTFK